MKILYLTSHVLLVSITTVCCFLRLTPDTDAEYKDDVYVRVKEGGRTRRSIDDKFHPETYDFNLPVAGSNLSIHLKRNDYLNTQIPTLTLRAGSFRYKGIPDKEDSVFYQDIRNGAVFVVQEDQNKVKNMFGVFHVNEDEYVVQTPELSSTTSFGDGLNKFQIFREPIKNLTFNDIVRTQITETKLKPILPVREKRQAGGYQVELLIVVDYSIYQYWYGKSTKATTIEKEDDTLATIRQFYAFIINGMDAMYKNIQTSSYTMSIVFAGLLVAQTQADSSWTESVAVTSTDPYQVDSSNALSNFRTWIRSTSNLPGHDHAMLFTKYDLTSSGSTSNAGLAYVGVVCTDSSQSIVEDHFNFIMLTVASHELGHSLSASHDGTGNACSSGNSYIMAPSSGSQSGATATNPWIFSSCSTTYFTDYIFQTEISNPCMSSLSVGYNASALSEYTEQLPGQVYDADKQCQNIQGPNSFFCKDRYNNDFSTICTTLWCADPYNPGYCVTSTAADGTLCGDQKWCISGVCNYDMQAPSGSSLCLYGEKEGPIFSNQDWNCSVIGSQYPYNCPNIATQCCESCAAYLTTTTTTTTTAGTGTTAIPTTQTTGSTTTSAIQLSDADLQCETSKGAGSYMCRGLYNGDYTSICTTLWCANPANTTVCQSATAADGTLCGNQKWCQSGVCVASPNAPTGDENCLYGDKLGAVFTNGWTCADMVAIAPNNCPVVPVTCCASCYTPTTIVTGTTMSPSSGLSSMITSPAYTTSGPSNFADAQCESDMGPGSYLCRSMYAGNYTSICTSLHCSDPYYPSYCYSSAAADGTMCGDGKWCQAGICSADANAPSGNDACLYGDVKGPSLSNGLACADLTPNNCGNFSTECCASCNASITTPTMPPTMSPTSGPTFDVDIQCENAKGLGSFMCRGLYNGDYTSICTTLWCANPANTTVCQSASAADGTLCGNQKWCQSGMCVASLNAPTGDENCLYGDKLGAVFTNGWTCADIVANAPNNCPSVPVTCCASCYTPTTMSTGSSMSPSSEFSSMMSSTAYPTIGQSYFADAQCESDMGPGSFLCRSMYAGNYTSICTSLHCSDPYYPSYCYSSAAADGTMCGDGKWCQTGVCTADPSAPSGNDACLYGDVKGPSLSNGLACADLAPNNCGNFSMECCASCNASLPIPTMPPTMSPTSGQSYDVDIQCENAQGYGSFMCRGLYNGDYTSICTTLWCANPANTTVCQSETAADGTLCGNQKWCQAGVCVASLNAPTGDENCLYGDKMGAVFSNGWTCADIVANAPSDCPAVPVTCCASCSSSTTMATGSSMFPSSGLSSMIPSTAYPTIGQSYFADAQCESDMGPGSFLCRSMYAGNYTSICTSLHCSDPYYPSYCYSSAAADGTMCGDGKWCQAGVCTADSNAPSGNDACLYGDVKGPSLSNGLACADLTPNNCGNFSTECCASCNASITIPTMPPTMSPTSGQTFDADIQCENAQGLGSFMCRGLYNGDYTSICSTLWCANPANTTVCQSATAADGTLCGNQKWCQAGVCVASLNAPTGDENCLYGDKIGAVFSNGWTCADIVANAPSDCPAVPVTCCASCSSSTTMATGSTMFPVSGLSSMIPSTAYPTIGQNYFADAQCESDMGPGSFLCRSMYAGNYTSICTSLHCSDPYFPSYCYSSAAADGTMCGDGKWCQSGVCTADFNAPSGDDTCLYGDVKGPVSSNNWTCTDMVANAPHNCASYQTQCCASCNTSMTLSPTTLPTATTTRIITTDLPTITTPSMSSPPSTSAPPTTEGPLTTTLSMTSPPSTTAPQTTGGPPTSTPSMTSPPSTSAPTTTEGPLTTTPSMTSPPSTTAPQTTGGPPTSTPSMTSPPSTSASTTTEGPPTSTPSMTSPPSTTTPTTTGGSPPTTPSMTSPPSTSAPTTTEGPPPTTPSMTSPPSTTPPPTNGGPTTTTTSSTSAPSTTLVPTTTSPTPTTTAATTTTTTQTTTTTSPTTTTTTTTLSPTTTTTSSIQTTSAQSVQSTTSGQTLQIINFDSGARGHQTTDIILTLLLAVAVALGIIT